MVRIWVLLPVLILLSSPAWAYRDNPPEPGLRYRVIEPVVGEVEVRSGPSVVGETIAIFDEKVRDVVVTGRVSVSAGRVWWEIVHKDVAGGSGWVAARFLAPIERTAGRETGYPLECTGAEPEWSLEVATEQGKFTSAEDADQSWSVADWLPARGQKGRFVVPLLSPADDGSGYLLINRTLQFCRAGSTDVEYPFDATLIAPSGAVFGGCCARGG
jgi:uncharacterized membrane protein